MEAAQIEDELALLLGQHVDVARAEHDLAGIVAMARVDRLHPRVVGAADRHEELDFLRDERFLGLAV